MILLPVIWMKVDDVGNNDESWWWWMVMVTMMVTMMVNVCDDDCYLVMKVRLVKEVMSCDVLPVAMFFSCNRWRSTNKIISKCSLPWKSSSFCNIPTPRTGKCQSLSVTFTLRTSLQDVLGRPYMMSCIFFFILLTEYMDYKVALIINDDAIPQTLIFIVGLSVTLQISKFLQSPKDIFMRCPVTFLQHSKAAKNNWQLQISKSYMPQVFIYHPVAVSWG